MTTQQGDYVIVASCKKSAVFMCLLISEEYAYEYYKVVYTIHLVFNFIKQVERNCRYLYKLPYVISLFPAEFSAARQVLSLLATAEPELSHSILGKVAVVFS